MKQLKRSVLTVAVSSAILMSFGNVQAQEAGKQTAEQLDTVKVTGIRRSIAKSIDTKKEETTIVEAVSSEDIGKLPDTSIADSIARLPGLTAQRFGGRPQEINIRGFAGDFSTALLNGREQVSLGNNRGVEFDQYPSELMSQVVVHKTTQSDLVGQGLSGTVNMKTVRPLSFSDRVVAFNLRGDMNKISGGDNVYGHRFTASYIDQFADNTVGLALGYARMKNPGQAHQFEAWGYDGGVLGGGKLYAISNDNSRDGLMGVLEWKPNADYHMVLDVFYSKFDKDETKRGMEFGFSWGPAGPAVSKTVNANGTAIAASFKGFKPVMRNDYNAAHDGLFSIGWSHELRLGDHWKAKADIGTSSATRRERILETYAGLANGASDNVSIALNSGGYFDFDFGLDYANPANFRLTDAGGWGQDGYLKDFEVRDSLTSLRFDFEREFDSGFISSLVFGGNITDRTKSRASDESFLCLGVCKDGASAPIPTNLLGTTTFGFAGLSNTLSYDALAALKSIYHTRANSHPDISNKNWEVHERVNTFFAQANINTDIGSVAVRGNIGVQAVNVDQSSTGVATFEGAPLSQPATRGASYTDYLPSLNLSFGLPAEQFIRFGASRQMARPRMDELRANAGYGINRNNAPGCPGAILPCWSGGGGNPALRPWLANAYDLSYEKYFGDNKGYVSAAYFYKQLKTYIYNQTVPFDFSQLPVPPNGLPAPVPASSIGLFTQPMNGDGGMIKGWELAVSLPFDMFWEPLHGLGFIGSYSDTSSSIHPNGPGTSEPLPGLSKRVTNMTLYYERAGFSTRVSRRSRSPFVGEVQGFGGDRTKIFFGGESVVDFQIGYTFQSGPMNNLGFILQLNNLTNEPFRSFDGSPDRPKNYWEYGRTVLFGVNYKF